MVNQRASFQIGAGLTMKINTIRNAVAAIKNRAAVLKIYGVLTDSDADAFMKDAEQIIQELDEPYNGTSPI